jgi:hypothetical protein
MSMHLHNDVIELYGMRELKQKRTTQYESRWAERKGLHCERTRPQRKGRFAIKIQGGNDSLNERTRTGKNFSV